MARVRFHSTQYRYTDGQRECELRAEDYRALCKAIEERFVGMPTCLLTDVMVAIDGEVVHRPFLEELQQNSEVVFVRRISAG